MDWKKIYSKTSFMVKDDNGDEVTFTQKGGLPESVKDKQFAIITAWNPNNESLSQSENIERNLLLEANLSELLLTFYPSFGIGTDGHQEASFTIEGMSLTQAIALGKKYEQYAIAYNDSNGFVFERC